MTESVSSATAETAVLGGGCFWCLEAVFDELARREVGRVGLCGRQHAESRRYEEVCSGRTGHAEVVRVTFDPAVLSFRDLLTVFFTIHDPTTLNRQGNDVGTQYRSVIFCPERRAARDGRGGDGRARRGEALARSDRDRDRGRGAVLRGRGAITRSISTAIRAQPYCRAVVEPKVAKFRKQFAERLKNAPAEPPV